ncbi:hypothetical protein DPMN_101964 [Dreissena polymorpha]|uniref:Uncharacterized protein n=1 Tax=Dreissena polymorpha TaxID=45954 RepID=A0A9D4RA65_DREPO|nr:hypothetical protein DPMN_101964 [Dreissena polymorpha]
MQGEQIKVKGEWIVRPTRPAGRLALEKFFNACPGVRSKFQKVHCRTYAHSYNVFRFQGSSANSVGDSGQDGRTDRRRR